MTLLEIIKGHDPIPAELSTDKKLAWKLASEFRAKTDKSPNILPSLHDREVERLAEVMHTLPVVPRMMAWSAVAGCRSCLRRIHTMIEDLMVQTAHGDVESKKLVTEYMNTPPETREPWLRDHGYID